MLSSLMVFKNMFANNMRFFRCTLKNIHLNSKSRILIRLKQCTYAELKIGLISKEERVFTLCLVGQAES